MEQRFFYTITGSPLRGKGNDQSTYEFTPFVVLAESERYPVSLLMPIQTLGMPVMERNGEDQYKLTNIDFFDTEKNELTPATLNEYSLLFGYELRRQPLYEIEHLLEYQFENTNDKQGFIHTLKYQVLNFKLRPTIDYNPSNLGYSNVEPELKPLISADRKDLINNWIAQKEKKLISNIENDNPEGGLELAEKLLIIRYLQRAKLFPVNNSKKGDVIKNFNQFIAELLSEKTDTIKKGFQRIDEVLRKKSEGKKLTQSSKNLRLKQLNKVKELFNSIDQPETVAEIESLINHINT